MANVNENLVGGWMGGCVGEWLCDWLRIHLGFVKNETKRVIQNETNKGEKEVLNHISRHHSRNVPITQASPELMRYKAKREQIESTAVGKYEWRTTVLHHSIIRCTEFATISRYFIADSLHDRDHR